MGSRALSLAVLLLTATLLAGPLAASGSQTLGPGRVLRDWEVRPGKSVGFSVFFTITSVSGPSGFEVALAKGPYRLGVIVVYSQESATLYVMRGDQNTWVRLSPVKINETINITVAVNLEKQAMNVSLNGEARSYGYNVSGAPEKLRLALIPLAGNMTLEIHGLAVFVDGEATNIVVPEATPGTTTTTTTTTLPTETTTTTTYTTTTTATTTTTTMEEGGGQGRISARLVLALLAALAVVAVGYWALGRR